MKNTGEDSAKERRDRLKAAADTEPAEAARQKIKTQEAEHRSKEKAKAKKKAAEREAVTDAKPQSAADAETGNKVSNGENL